MTSLKTYPLANYLIPSFLTISQCWDKTPSDLLFFWESSLLVSFDNIVHSVQPKLRLKQWLYNSLFSISGFSTTSGFPFFVSLTMFTHVLSPCFSALSWFPSLRTLNWCFFSLCDSSLGASNGIEGSRWFCKRTQKLQDRIRQQRKNLTLWGTWNVMLLHHTFFP